MKAFARLYARLDATTSNNAKLAAMIDYFQSAPSADAAWAAYFLAGGKPRQLVPAKVIRSYVAQSADIPEWLFEESYQAVGDLAETLSLLLPRGEQASDVSLGTWMREHLLPLRGQPADALIEQLDAVFDPLDTLERFVCAKLITGSLRVGVSKLLVTRALARVAGLDSKELAQRLIGYTDIAAHPQAEHFQRLIAAVAPGQTRLLDGRPYPFFLAHPLQLNLDQFESRLGSPADWQVEWKWDGIRAQLVKREGSVWIWSRGEELVTDRFPELKSMASALPDGIVLDGEIVVWRDDRVQSFSVLQQRLGRKNLTAKLLADIPAAFLAYDLLEQDGCDIRHVPQAERRRGLQALHARVRESGLLISPLLIADTWEALAQLRLESRARGVEGMMLKAVQSTYGVGRGKAGGVWWKWKIDPFSVDAVLIYAQRGHGRRASLYSDYTFAVWDQDASTGQRHLVPFAKAYSGLTDDEIRQVDAIVRKTTIEKFGPVRSLKPSLVFELGFEGISRSARHKSGIAVRFPRMLRWRHDKSIGEADSLATLSELLPQ